MTYKGKIGQIAVKSKHNIEWKIKDFFSFNGEYDFYTSPDFTFSNCKWCFQSSPNGKRGSREWMSMYLIFNSYSSCTQGLKFSFGLRESDGKVYKRHSAIIWSFDAKHSGKGYREFLKRSEIIEQKSKLAPLDTLTITCTMWKTEKMSSLSRNFLEMFESQKACDATLEVKNTEFPVHKIILMAGSPVFSAMFETSMKEKNTGVVNIKDCNPEPFREFLEYMYTGQRKNVTNHMFELYKIANKYDVEDLKAVCLTDIMSNLSVENVTDAICLAHKFGENGLRDRVREFFNENCTEILRTIKWLHFLQKYPHQGNELLIQMAEHLKK